eukprot:CAMPEP_0202908678 /NCGR_PEP_ID=MMETSP1392-20130828/46850_1 /ASSEMBLY_ACC=CAM_ASM_000868 /TAXON_ID=225041 /ORGANISM="Chlamydomonas chlamydogama, Strain SAG 11-48b" /LENGTH=418 /DNA_ID=CAMNT_0049598121 /DNA_START=84 /DNA_END=1340 /DNA_ORIENTATION=+
MPGLCSTHTVNCISASRNVVRAPVLSTSRPRCGRCNLKVFAQDKFSPQELGLAPAKPKTAYGEMLAYYLKMEPQLFKTAVEDQLSKLQEEREDKERRRRQLESGSNAADASELTLYKRMEEVRASEVSATLEDLMYISILEKFVLLGVEMLPRMDGFVDVAPTNLVALTEGLHSREAIELVKEHIMGVMGPALTTQFSNAVVKMSKFQMVQVYAASIMFGYFLRRVDQRFQLERSMGTLPMSREDAVARLERLFSMADAEESTAEPDRPTSSSSASSSSNSSSLMKKEKSALRKYVESFDQAMMVETARIVSAEGAALVERQATALLGDIKKLTAQMQSVVGTDATSKDQVLERMARAVETDEVETVAMTVGTQRRAVLEAVAYGTFLRDVETWVQSDYGLLTPLPPPRIQSMGPDDE